VIEIEKMNGINRLYFETSSVNYLYDNVFNNSEFSSIKTKKLQSQKGRKWQISNVALWEIFLTKDEERRYNLFDFSRTLFHDTLICSPEEIIINYLSKGCPNFETHYELDSKALFSKEWSIACKKLDYFFEPDKEQLEKYTDHLRFVGNYFVRTSKGYVLSSYLEIDKSSTRLDCAFLKYIYNKVICRYDENLDLEFKNYIFYSIQVVLMTLCYGIGLDHQTIEAFWNKGKKTEPLERLDITVNKYPEIFFRGPLANVTKMILCQAKNKTGRGLFFDSLQTIYTTYCDMFVTNDNHFLKLKDDNQIDPNMHKITPVTELRFLTHDKKANT
jgi:hypothetical protein